MLETSDVKDGETKAAELAFQELIAEEPESSFWGLQEMAGGHHSLLLSICFMPEKLTMDG